MAAAKSVRHAMAYELGKEDYWGGHDEDDCPFDGVHEELCENWQEGWTTGESEDQSFEDRPED